jgi:hypothetical protein
VLSFSAQNAERGAKQRERELKSELDKILKLSEDTISREIAFDISSEFSSKIDGLLSGLEECNTEDKPTRSTKLWGGWQLVFTNSPPMKKNNGVTGLGSLPFASLVELEQNLYSNNTAETIERLNIPPFGIVCSSLRGPMVTSTPQVILPRCHRYDRIVLTI